MNEVTKDVDGKESSKRKLGIKLLNISIYMALVYFVAGLICSLFSKEFNYVFPLDIWWTMIGSGSSLLGITLVERFSSKK